MNAFIKLSIGILVSNLNCARETVVDFAQRALEALAEVSRELDEKRAQISSLKQEVKFLQKKLDNERQRRGADKSEIDKLRKEATQRELRDYDRSMQLERLNIRMQWLESSLKNALFDVKVKVAEREMQQFIIQGLQKEISKLATALAQARRKSQPVMVISI